MTYELSDRNLVLQELYRDFAKREVEPLAAEVDEQEMFPVQTIPKMAKVGMFGIPFDKKYGGEGGDTLSYVLCVEELSKVCATTGVILSAHTSLCASPIETYGNEFQKQKYLVPLAKGEKLGAFALTEANAGTDASKQETTAVLDGDNYILNGTKLFITNAGYADTYVVFAMTKPELGVKGISAFIVDADTPGFSVGPHEKKLGIRGSATSELIFENCVIPKENLLLKEGHGFKIAMKTLDGGRIGIAAQALGIAEGAIEETIQYVKERKQFGKPIAAFQNTKFALADMANKIEAAKLLVYNAASKKDNDLNFSSAASHAKLFAAQAAIDITTKCVQLHGGYGYTRDYPIERMMRDAKITEIYEGTSEVQKMVIAASLLK